MTMKHHTHAPNESRMCRFDFEVKGQGHDTIMIGKYGFRTIPESVIHL